MTASEWMICLGHEGWQTVKMSAGGIAVDDPQRVDQPASEEQTARIAETLFQQGYAGEPILLALDSAWCLSATLPIDSPQQLRHRQAMRFRLEESLPWEAEEAVADYVGHDRTALAVAVQYPQLKRWIDALESHHLRVQSVTPLILLGLAQHLSWGDWPSSHAVLWAHDSALDLIVVQNSKPQDWRVVLSPRVTLVQVLQVLALTRVEPLPVVCYHVDDELMQRLRQVPDIEIQAQPSDPPTLQEAAAKTARDALSAKQDLWIELRREALGVQDRLRSLRGRIRMAVIAACFFALALIASFLMRSHQFDVRAGLAYEQRAEIHRALFPEADVPPGVRSRLESELAKLKGIRGDSAELPESPAALQVLYELMASLPPGLRYRISEIRIDDGQLDVNGEVRDHGDADKIATCLREHGFDVSSPFTQRRSSSSVIVRISARLLAPRNTTVGKPL